jgi:alpha-1,3-mannosyltransferase
LKIVHVVRQFSPSVGGLEASVLNLARAQRGRLGVDARVVTLDRVFGRAEVLPHEETVQGLPVTRLGWLGSSRYPLAPSVLRHLHGADVLHVHAIDFFFDYLAITRPWHRRRMIASTHGGFFHTQRHGLAKRLWFDSVTRASIQAYERIVACSHSDATLFASRAGARLAVIENGIDQARFADAAAPAQTRVIVCFGRFAQHKRIGALFTLLAALRAHHPGWRLIVAGREADQSAAALQAAAQAAGVADAVRFVIGPSDAQLRALLREASYSACLSAYEGFGLAAVEAMSAGLLPILSPITPFRRLVTQTRLGLLVDPDDVPAAATTIEASVLADQPGYEARRAAVMLSVRRYDWDEVAKQYVALYAAPELPRTVLAAARG